MTSSSDLLRAATALHRDALVFDAHADTLTEMTDRRYDLDDGPPGTHLDLPRCAHGNLDAQVFTCFVNPRYLPDAADRVRAMLDTMDRQLALFPESLALCLHPGDIVAARERGQLAGVLAIEGGHAIENDLDVLREFHRRGVRSMTLTWNNSNEWADGCGDEGPHGGLSARGREIVATMEELGMVVDISHVARSTFDDVLAVSRRPLIASHSCARALRDHPRNLTDEQLSAIAATGGVACVNFYPGFLVTDGVCHLGHLLDHVMHCVERAGPEHVGLGSDFDGIPAGPDGLEEVSDLPRLTAGLLQRGLGEAQIRGVLGGNLLRIFDAPEAGGPAT